MLNHPANRPPPSFVRAFSRFRYHDTTRAFDPNYIGTGSLKYQHAESTLRRDINRMAQVFHSYINERLIGGIHGATSARDDFTRLPHRSRCSRDLSSRNWIGLEAMARSSAQDRVGLCERSTGDTDPGGHAVSCDCTDTRLSPDTLTLGGLLAAVTQIPDWTCPGCGKTYADPADVPTTCPECGEYADTDIDTDVDTLTLGTLIALAEAAWGDGR